MDRYSRPKVIARFIEAEWGDLLLQHASPPETAEPLFPLGDRTTVFYKEIVRLLASQKLSPRRILDVGSATGRMVREFGRTFGDAEEILGCEPSTELYRFSKSILESSPAPDWLPIPNTSTGDRDYVEVGRAFQEAVVSGAGAERIRLENCLAELAPRPEGYFDLACCLNVADRHPNPRQLVETLRHLVRVGGHLCLASPLDWNEKHTPRDHFTDDLRSLFDPESWSFQAEENLEYTFRTSSRRLVTYISQVLVVRRTA